MLEVMKRFHLLASVKRLAKNGPSLIGLAIMTAFFAWALVEGLLQLVGMATKNPSYGWALLPYNPFQESLGSTLLSPSLVHPMGTDDLGRDILVRVLYAVPIDAGIALIVVAGGVVVGGLIGLTAGYFGKGVEEVNMRVTDLFLAFPALILALVIEATLGRDVIYAVIALLVVWWPSYARIFRGEMLRTKHMKFIDAAMLSGLSDFSIILRHGLRSSLNTVVSYATIDLGNVILVYSILSFLGLGVAPPSPEWGTMVAQGLTYFPSSWWYSILPGVVITVIVIGAALLGDGIRDMLAGEL
jgi:peptide/nickel transport system permease protein